jgi:hypothetical protein
LEGKYTLKASDEGSIKTQFKHMLAGSTLGVAINAMYSIGWRFGGFYPEFLPTILVYSFFSVSPQNIMVAFFATLIGTYVGLWTIGKVKLDSPTKGVIVGLIVTVFSVPVVMALLLALYHIYAIHGAFILLSLERSLISTIFENTMGSLLGGFLGGVLVKFMAPDYCPKCKAKLRIGILFCPRCGWGR